MLGRLRRGEQASVQRVRPSTLVDEYALLQHLHRRKIADFAKAERLASMFGWREYTEAGGLASYGANQRATYVRLAAYADRILRGEKPADLPIEQPTTFELVINATAARVLGVDVAPSILARADEVID